MPSLSEGFTFLRVIYGFASVSRGIEVISDSEHQRLRAHRLQRQYKLNWILSSGKYMACSLPISLMKGRVVEVAFHS